MVNVDFNKEIITLDNKEIGRIFLRERGNFIVLDEIRIYDDYKNTGHGQQAMLEIIKYANQRNKILALTPSDSFGANKNRLIDWYKSLGFIMNKGKNKDFETMELMYRKPTNNIDEIIIRRKIWTLNENTGQFDLKQFDSLTSFTARKRYADEHLTKIAAGSGRIAYKTPDGKVLKLAKNQKGVAQNEYECELGNDYYVKSMVTEVYDCDPNNLWVLAEFAKKLTPNRFKELTGVSIELLNNYLFNEYSANNPSRRMGKMNMSDGMKEYVQNNEFANELQNIMLSYDMPAGDLGRLSSYGEVIRDGQPDVVLVDYGLSSDVYTTHYSRVGENLDEYFGIHTQMQDVLQNYTDASDVTDGGYAFAADQPQTVSETIDDYTNISNVDLQKIIDFVKGFDPYENITGKKISDALKYYMATVQNIDKALENTDDQPSFYNKLMDVQKYLKRFGLLKEDLVYWGADDATKDVYELGAESINEEFVNEDVAGLDRVIGDKISNYIAKKVYGSKADFIGHGMFGYAYGMGDKVIKITKDKSEALDSLEIKGKKNNYIADIYEVFHTNIKTKSGNGDVYAIVLERLETPKVIDKIYQSLDRLLEDYTDRQGIPSIVVDEYINNRALWDSETKDDVMDYVLKDHPKEKKFLIDLLNIVDEARAKGIASMDFINSSNLGYKPNGNLAFFDAGFGDYYKQPSSQFSKINIGENVQQMDSKYVKTGKFTDEDKQNVLSITNGDNFTKTIADLYAWILQIPPYDRGEQRRDVSEFNTYYKKDLTSLYNQMKGYNKNVFPITNFTPANTNEHPIEIWSALKRRAEILRVFSRIPSVYQRNLRYIIRKPQPIEHYDYYLKEETREISQFLDQVDRLSDDKKEKILQKIFSSKNQSMKELLNHIKSTEVMFFNHEDGVDELIDKVNYEADTDEAELLYHNGDIVVIDVKSADAMKSLGCGSQWCFATEYGTEHWQNYADNDHVNIVYNFEEDPSSKLRMVVVLPDGSVYNMYNDYMDYDPDGWDYLQEIGAAEHVNVRFVAQEDELKEDGTTLYTSAQGTVNSGDISWDLQGDEDMMESVDDITNAVIERIMTWMPKNKAVKVKDKCKLGGKGDGTSDACNQGDMDALEFSEINDDNAHRRKDNVVNVAETDLLNERIITQSELLEIGRKLREENEAQGKIQYGALMIYFELEQWDELISKIKEEDLYDDGSGTFGREDEPHITVLYGFHDEVTDEDFYEILEEHGTNFSLKGHKISIFENNNEFDVVKIDVEPTDELLALRDAVMELPHTLTYKDYHPHMTIAYVKKGEGKKYVKDFGGKYLKLESDKLVFSNKDEEKTEFLSEEIVTNEEESTYNEGMEDEGKYNSVWQKKIDTYKENLKDINFEVADKYRDGLYSRANDELKKIESGEMTMDDVFFNPDSPLRNMIILSHSDKTDYRTSLKHNPLKEEIINEIGEGTKPFEWEYTGKIGNYAIGYKFTTSNGNEYNVDFVGSITKGEFDIMFKADNTVNLLTNENLVLNVMSTIVEIIKDFIKRYDPKFIEYYPIKMTDGDNRREKLYDAYVKKNLPPNWGVKNKEGDVVLLFNKMKYSVDENTDMIKEANIMQLKDLPFKDQIERMGGKIYSVGGAVRDEFLGKESKDLDILITGIPMDKLEQALQPFGKVDAVGKSFGILKFKPQGASEDIDVAIPRTETATGEGGHKGFDVTSDHTLSIEDDLRRRDFTINAIAKDIDGNLIDPFGGQKDLANKNIKVVNPEAFSDDPLRMIRAVQFAARFGFTIDDQTKEMIKKNAGRIKEIAGERILEELRKVVDKNGDKRQAAQLLKDTGLFQNIFGAELKQSTIDRAPFEETKTLGEFIFLLLKSITNKPADMFKSRLKGDIPTAKEIMALNRAFIDVENEAEARVIAHNMFLHAPQALDSEIIPKNIKFAAKELLSGKYPKSLKDLQINGNDLMLLGLKGKEIGDALNTLLVDVYSDEVNNVKEDLLNRLNNNNE